MPRISWDELFVGIVKLYACRSACKQFQVGVVFVRDKRILSAGYNGPPTGEPHCIDVGCAKCDEKGRRLPAGSGLCRGAHAEMNAIANASHEGVNLRGSTVYCTYSPCYDCCKVLVNLGIKRYVYYLDYPDERRAAWTTLLRRKKIKVVKFK